MTKTHDIVASALNARGISFSHSTSGTAELYMPTVCPLCGHGSDDHPNSDCLLVVSPALNGDSRHEYRCAHSVPDVNEDQTEMFFRKVGMSMPTSVTPTANLARTRSPHSKRKPKQRSATRGTQATRHPEYIGRLHSRLMRHQQAVAWLNNVKGLDTDTLSHAGAGLSESYRSKKSGQTQQDAFALPWRDKDGQLSSYRTYFDIPGVTINPTGQSWSSHEPSTYYSKACRGRPEVLVFEDVFDLLLTHQTLAGYGHDEDYLLICPSVPGSVPGEWDQGFFSQFRNIYACPSSSESQFATVLTEAAGVAVNIVFPERAESWQEYLPSTQSAGDLLSLVDSSSPAPTPAGDAGQIRSVQNVMGNLLPYSPIDCNGAFNNGYLYYPTRMIRQDCTEDGSSNPKIIEVVETVLIRSDRTIQRVKDLTPLKRSNHQHAVKRLTDDTLIIREPEASEHQTWSFESISRYLAGHDCHVGLSELLFQVRGHLASTVWLPRAEDYTLLSLVAAASYCMTVFDSVPLVLLTGDKGTGKSELTNALIDVSANAKMVGQGSAAAIARTIDQTRGLLAFDDMDHLGGNRKGDTAAEQLRQQLKQSYSQKSSSKVVFDGAKGRTLNFYGIKVINNTTGIDPITGSRCLHIYTRKIPPIERSTFAHQSAHHLDADGLATLRDNLHTWTFSNVRAIRTAYESTIKGKTSRTEEIHAPLKALAALAGNATIESDLKTALEVQHSILVAPDGDLDDILVASVQEFIHQGYNAITPTHLALELRYKTAGGTSLVERGHDTATLSPEWVGRQLRKLELAHPELPAERVRVRGHKLRAIPLVAPSAVDGCEGLASGEQKHTTPVHPAAFCAFTRADRCARCRYAALACPIRP